MQGNSTLPGVSISESYRVTNGSIWQGQPQVTWFKAVSVNGTEGETIKAGTIMKCLIDDGSYIPITEADIVAAVADLPGVRLAIVADKTAKTGTEITTGEGVDAVTEAVPSSVLVGVSGIVNKELLYVGDKRFTELEEAQQITLNLQLEAWHFMLVNVIEA